MRKKYIYIILLSFLVYSCNLEESPKDSPNAQQVFSSQSGLEKYTNSFYSLLPSASDITHADELSDYASGKTIPDLLQPGQLTPRTVSRWGWGNLRNINYFLQQNHRSNISKKVRDNYNGIARFYRAWFYFRKVKRYGKVPWISKPLELNSKELTAPRDPRTLVMDSVLADINYAIANITVQHEQSRTKITKDVALALKSRIALFEGTYRFYHHELGLESTADKWLKECVKASKKLMGTGTYSVYDGDGVAHSYKAVFTSETPIATSVLLANVYSTSLGHTHDANWWYTSGTYGDGLSFIRPFINTYLMRDGTPFTDKKNYKTMTYLQDVKNRDTRLLQTIRGPQYKMLNASGNKVLTPPNFSYTVSGYQPIKWCIPDKHYNKGNYNINAIPIFRYAEVLLNYAEAKAILGTITNQDWNETIGELRRRGGITDGTTTLPTKVDSYLQKTFYPNISNPVILEIRRARGIELTLEGFRFDDLRRWDVGNLMAKFQWKGMYVPKANTYMDITGDGKPDVYFYTKNPPENRKSGVQYVNVSTNDFVLSNGDSGYVVALPNTPRKWEDKKYLYPINIKDLQKNQNLKQNPGW